MENILRDRKYRARKLRGGGLVNYGAATIVAAP